MKNPAAVYFEGAKEFEVVEADLEGPRAGEVLVKMAAAGLCHSDDHRVQGDMVAHDPANGIIEFPMIGGHEGAGVVQEVGPGVTTLQPGDHVVLTFVPSCGRCRMCVTGYQMLCDRGADIQNPGKVREKARNSYKGELLFAFGLGSFAEYCVCEETYLVKIDKDIPLPVAAMVGCCVLTGWGSAVNRAEVVPGDVVVVVGVGGLGTSAVQGARFSGARYVVAVDPVEFKRRNALEMGATHAAASMEAAFPIVAELTRGLMADKVIMTPSLLLGELMEPANMLTRKGGTIVATAVAPTWQTDITFNLFSFAMSNKTLKGTLYGQSNPRYDVPRVLDLYRDGLIKLDEMITQTYALADVNKGYKDMRDGLNIRGVIVYE